MENNMTELNKVPLTFEHAIAIVDKNIQAIFAKIEADKKLHQEEMKKRDEEMKKRDEKRDEEMKATIKRLDRHFGDITNRFGEVIEYMIAPDLCSKFRKYGFNFQQSNTRQQVSDGNKVLTEIDILLEDGDATMAVEVKTKPTMYDLNRHIRRMSEIQQYPPRSVRGTRLYGAIAGAVITDEIKESAFEAGFYVICQTGDNVEVIPPPDNFVVKYWDAKSK